MLDNAIRYLAHCKLPREMRFIDFEDIPHSTSSKIQRHLLEQSLKKPQ
jgi:acyl-coenzyme A synthetase/AMP-(fatty) acid ligase